MVSIPSLGEINLNPFSGLSKMLSFLANPYFLYLIFFLVVGYFLYMIFVRCGYMFVIFEKVGKNYRWKGIDYAYVINIDGKKMVKLVFRKILQPYPRPDDLIAKNRFQNVLLVLNISPDEFIPLNFSEKCNELVPIDQDVKFFTWETHKSAVSERNQSKSIFERHNQFFSWALWGVVGVMIIWVSAKYGNSLMADATSKSLAVMKDANAQSASAVSQMASALTSINFPQPVVVPPQQSNIGSGSKPPP